MSLFSNIHIPEEKEKKKNLFQEKNLFDARPENKHKFINKEFKPTLKVSNKIYSNREVLVSAVKYCLVDNGQIEKAIRFIDESYKVVNLERVINKYVILLVDKKNIDSKSK